MSTDDLAAAFTIARGVLDKVAPDDYDKTTPCASWSVRDLVNHMCEGANWVGLCTDAGKSA